MHKNRETGSRSQYPATQIQTRIPKPNVRLQSGATTKYAWPSLQPHYAINKKRPRTLYQRIVPLINQTGIKLSNADEIIPSAIPPWETFHLQTDSEWLPGYKSVLPNVAARLFYEHKAKYSQATHIYTDGSKMGLLGLLYGQMHTKQLSDYPHSQITTLLKHLPSYKQYGI